MSHILIQDKGRLGNQLFQGAAALALAWDNNCTDVYMVKHFNKQDLTMFKDESEFKFNAVKYTEPSHRYNKIPFKGDMILDGYFQSYKYFDHHKDKIKKTFLPENKDIDQIYNKLKGQNTVALHIRRGDYLELKEHHPNLSFNYYRNAVKLFPTNTKYLVFSDDVKWCQEQEFFKNLNCSFVTGNTEKPYRDLELMARCDGFIIANSSFSWWAAYLSNGKLKKVYPQTWFGPKNQHLDVTDMTPPDWTAMPDILTDMVKKIDTNKELSIDELTDNLIQYNNLDRITMVTCLANLSKYDKFMKEFSYIRQDSIFDDNMDCKVTYVKQSKYSLFKTLGFICDNICISLENCKDRRIHTRIQTNKVGLNTEFYIAQPNKIPRVGCTESHIAAIKLAKERKLKRVLIFEDDVMFEDKNIELNRQIPSDFDILYLGCNPMRGYRAGKGLAKIESAFMAHAYILDEQVYDYILDNINTEYLKDSIFNDLEQLETFRYEEYIIDVFYAKMVCHKRAKGYALYPHLAYQRPCYSSIQNQIVDYREGMNTRFEIIYGAVQSTAKKPTILFDVGANVGKYTEVNQKKYDKVVLIEADPKLADGLKQTFKDNKHVVENCVVSKDKEVSFYISNCNVLSTASTEWMASSRFNKEVWREIKGVSCLSIDELVAKHGTPSYMKIDVEGYEYNVIRSMTKKYCDLCFEWAEEQLNDILATLEYLARLGYSKFYIEHRDTYSTVVDDKDYVNFVEVTASIRKVFNKERKELWGMIHCK